MRLAAAARTAAKTSTPPGSARAGAGALGGAAAAAAVAATMAPAAFEAPRKEATAADGDKSRALILGVSSWDCDCPLWAELLLGCLWLRTDRLDMEPSMAEAGSR